MGKYREKFHVVSKIVFVATLAVLLSGAGAGCWARQVTVGTDVTPGDVTDFYYIYSTSTAPPHYQRYRFYVDGRKYMFYHETREGGGWPQTEKDITDSGSRQLSGAEWAEFFECLKGGIVENRKEHLEDGDAGPWLFLYWKGDRSRCQEFSFPSPAARFAFEELCARLKEER